MAVVRIFHYKTKELLTEISDGSADGLEVGNTFNDEFNNLLRVEQTKLDILTGNKDIFISLIE